ncbi:GNAT family N-acetyltransferase [Parabacteroides sp.]
MNTVIRNTEPSDYKETENLMREAFWNHYSPGCSEHYLVHIMRNHPTFVRELDFVAIVDGKIVGNVVYLKSIIKADDDITHEVLSLGPIAVHPDYQRKGIGRAMIDHTRNLARQMGFKAILLCGEPNYYSRQGFVPAETLGIRTADNMYFAALHVCELYENALAGVHGLYYEDEIYFVDENVVIEFDKGFPYKEKVEGTLTQERFNQVITMMRSADDL